MRTLDQILADAYKFHPSMIDGIRALIVESWEAALDERLYTVWYSAEDQDGTWYDSLVGIAPTVALAQELAQADCDGGDTVEKLDWHNDSGIDYAKLEDGSEYYLSYGSVYTGNKER